MTGLLLLGSLVVFFLVLGMLAREISEALLSLIRRPKRSGLSLPVSEHDGSIVLTPVVGGFSVRRTSDSKWWDGSEWVSEPTVAREPAYPSATRALPPPPPVVGHA